MTRTRPISSFLYCFGCRLEHPPDSGLGGRARAGRQAPYIKAGRPNWRMAQTISASASSVADAEIVCAIRQFGRPALMYGACLPARALPPKPESGGCSSRQPKQYKKLEIGRVRVISSSDKLELN